MAILGRRVPFAVQPMPTTTQPVATPLGTPLRGQLAPSTDMDVLEARSSLGGVASVGSGLESCTPKRWRSLRRSSCEIQDLTPHASRRHEFNTSPRCEPREPG